MATVYLEDDDEITTAIGRIRAVTDGDAVLVVPPGSKIATSRINFKLLAREAAVRRINVVAVSDEPQIRALAISAGLPAYDSIAVAEQTLATLSDRDRRLSERIRRTMPREHPDPRLDTALLPAQHSTVGKAATATTTAGTRRRVPIAPILVVGMAVLLVGAVAYGAFVFLPTATITVRPAAIRIQAPAFTVTADPTVAVVDTAAGIIPAERLDVPVHVSGTFGATGIDAHDTRASGTVRFRSENTLNVVQVPAETVISTPDGTEFATVADVTVPKASFATGPTQADTEVRAVRGGTKGNVDAGAITVVPQSLASQLITVTNPDPTTGGRHVEDQVVSQTDYDAAVASLSGQLDAALAAALTNRQNVARGLVAYSETAQTNAAQPSQPAADVVGTAASSFSLGLDSTAQVTAVNESLIDDVAAARLRAALARGQKLVSDEVTATHGTGTVIGDTVVYGVQASGLGYVDPNPQTLVATVLGKSLTDARNALKAIGTADIRVWPDFVDHLPDQPGRISVTIVPPSAAPAAPMPSPTTRATLRPSLSTPAAGSPTTSSASPVLTQVAP